MSDKDRLSHIITNMYVFEILTKGSSIETGDSNNKWFLLHISLENFQAKLKQFSF